MKVIPFLLAVIAASEAETDFTTGHAVVPLEFMEESELFDLFPDRAFRPDSGTLCIVTAQGDALVFRDLAESDDYPCLNRLVAYFPSVDYWVVEEWGYEWECWLLVNGCSGIRQEAISIPVLSPDRERFACAYRELVGCGFNRNGIQVWRIGADSLMLEYESPDEIWGPAEVQWGNASTIHYERIIVDWETMEPATESGMLVMTRDGVWTADP